MNMRQLAKTDIKIWESRDKEEKESAANFGNSPSGIPLYPYNEGAMRALAYHHCRENELLEFNPRRILRHMLLEPLKNFRDQYVDGEFPPVGFDGPGCPSNLQSELQGQMDDETLRRGITLAGIWGYGAQTLGELRGVMDPGIPSAFGLDTFSQVLSDTPSENIKKPVVEQPPAQGEKVGPVPGPVTDVSGEDELAESKKVDDYFKDKKHTSDSRRVS